jgi:hypothetical protein
MQKKKVRTNENIYCSVNVEVEPNCFSAQATTMDIITKPFSSSGGPIEQSPMYETDARVKPSDASTELCLCR